MAALGRCEHPTCGRPATRAIQIANMIRAVQCCEAHAADFRECASEHCDRLAQAVIAIGERQPGRRRRRELTKSLRRDLADLHGLEAAFAVDASAQPALVPTDVLCIPPWQADAQVHLRCQRLAGAIRDLIAADPSLSKINSKLP